MQKFLKQLLLFFMVFSLIAAGLQGLVSYRIKGREVLNLYDNFHVSFPKRADLLFMGSSRCITHYSPQKFDQAFSCTSINLGVDGHSELDMHLLKLTSYLKHNPPPKLILLNFDIFVNSNGYGGMVNKVHKDYFSRYAFKPFSESVELANYFDYNIAESYFPLYALLRYQMLPAAVSMKGENKWEKEGYARHDEAWDTSSHPVQIVDTLMGFHNKEYISNLQNVLLAFKKLCQDNQISLLLVQSPVYQPAFVNQPMAVPGQLAKMSGLPFFDFNLAPLNNRLENFYNANHLNTQGVNRFFDAMLQDSSFCNFIKAGLQKKTTH